MSFHWWKSYLALPCAWFLEEGGYEKNNTTLIFISGQQPYGGAPVGNYPNQGQYGGQGNYGPGGQGQSGFPQGQSYNQNMGQQQYGQYPGQPRYGYSRPPGNMSQGPMQGMQLCIGAFSWMFKSVNFILNVAEKEL